MQKTHNCWLYTLINPVSGEQSFATVEDPSENICIGVHGITGEYHQFDSSEAYHLHSWATPLGLTSKCAEVEFPIPDSLLPNSQALATIPYSEEVSKSKDKVFRLQSDGKVVFVMAPDRHEAASRASTMLHCKPYEIDSCRIDTKAHMLEWVRAGGFGGVIKPSEVTKHG